MQKLTIFKILEATHEINYPFYIKNTFIRGQCEISRNLRKYFHSDYHKIKIKIKTWQHSDFN